MDVGELAKLLGSGAAGATVAVTVLFVRGWVVPGYVYKAAVDRAERAEARLWETLPLLRRAHEVQDRTTRVADRAVGLSDKVVKEMTTASGSGNSDSNGGGA